MARVKGAMATRKRRNKTLKLAKGYWGAKSKHFKMAKEAVMKSGNYAYIGRRLKKRDFRQLWISCLQDERHELFYIHERSQEGWHHSQQKDAFRNRYQRRSRFHSTY